MKKVLFLIMSAFVALSANAQYDIKYRASDNYYLIKYGLDTTHVVPKGTTYAKLQYGNEVGLFYNNGQPIVNYVSHFLYNINGASVATPNALMDSLSLILGMPLDSIGGGGLAGVEHINGKDGDLKIVAGSNVTIDNSKSDTIVINATGGDFIPLSGTDTLKPVTGTIEILSENSGATYYMGEDPNTGYWGLMSEGKERLVSPYGYYWFDLDPIKNSSVSFDNGGDLIYYTNSNAPSQGIYGQMNSKRYAYTDSSYVQKYYVDSVASGGGDYLPLNIQDSTTVELNGNPVVFKGDNHSLVMNTPFEAFEIGGAVIDGFRAQQYNDILTMNGMMKIPVFFGDTIRYPFMFLSHGMPLSDTAKFTTLKGSLYDGLGFTIATADEESENNAEYQFFNDKFTILKNEQSVFEIDLTTGIIDAPYVNNKDSTNIAQVKDIIDLTSLSIITVDTSSYVIEPYVSSIVTLVDGSIDVYLPDVSQGIGNSIYIINDSSNGVNINSIGPYDIWANGSLGNSIIIPSDSTIKFINNGSYWAIF